MEGSVSSGGRRYIISRQPIGTANKQFQEISAEISKLEAAIQCLQELSQTFIHKSNLIESKLDICLDQSNQQFAQMDKKLSLLVRSSKRQRGVKRKKISKVDNTIQTDSSMFIKEEPKLKQIQEDKEDVAVKTSTVLVNNSNKTVKCEEVTGGSLVLTLNKEQHFPNGSWLGDSKDINRRVRVSLTKSKLRLLMETFTTPEKLALALMDRLFTRDTLATSNLTGRGKHQKKQLDPLIIYGIYCQLRHTYNISDADWTRIKNNMEAKCRFLWRRKTGANISTNEKSNNQQTATNIQETNAHSDQDIHVNDSCSNLVLYPLYQVDSHLVQADSQVVHVDGQLVQADSQEVHVDRQLVQVDSQTVHVDGQLVQTDSQVVHIDRQILQDSHVVQVEVENARLVQSVSVQGQVIDDMTSMEVNETSSADNESTSGLQVIHLGAVNASVGVITDQDEEEESESLEQNEHTSQDKIILHHQESSGNEDETLHLSSGDLIMTDLEVITRSNHTSHIW